MEVLKGALVAAACGCLISLVSAFLIASVMAYYLPEFGWGYTIGFLVRRTLGLSLMINLVIAPASFVAGLVFASLRSAVRQGVEQGGASTLGS